MPDADEKPDASVSDDVLRIFIAIELNDEVRQGVSNLQSELKRAGANVKWVEPGNMHLTLIFLGYVGIDRIPGIARALDEVAGHTSAFACEVAGIGAFGSPRSPRVVWVGIHTDKVLSDMQMELSLTLQDQGISLDDRPFKPHLTLGRIRSSHGVAPLMRKIETLAETKCGRFRTDSVVLIRSKLNPHGPEYSVLHRATLQSGTAEPG